jgi:hypothetical protein
VYQFVDQGAGRVFAKQWAISVNKQ